MDQHPHRPNFRQRFAGDSTVDEHVAVLDTDRLTRQSDHALDVRLGWLAGKMEDGDLPPLGTPKFVEELLNQDSVAPALDRR